MARCSATLGGGIAQLLDRQMLSTMKASMQVSIVELQTATNFGQLMAIFLWIYGLMSPISGLAADRINRKWIIVSSLFVWSAVTLLMGFAQNFTQLLALRALMGFSESLYIPAALSLIADYHDSKSRSIAIGIHMTGLYIGQSLEDLGQRLRHLFHGKHFSIIWFCWCGIRSFTHGFIKRKSKKEEDTIKIVRKSNS
jgi:MFS family permease